MTKVCDHYSSPLMPQLSSALIAQGLAFFPLAHIRLGNQRVFPSTTHEKWHADTNVCGKGTESRDVRHSALLLLRLMIWRAARKSKNSSPPKVHQLWGIFLLRTPLNVIIGGPNELWPHSPTVCAILNYHIGCMLMLIKMMNAALSSNELEDWERREESCFSLHDLVLFSASHCTKAAYYFNHMFTDIRNHIMRL